MNSLKSKALILSLTFTQALFAQTTAVKQFSKTLAPPKVLSQNETAKKLGQPDPKKINLMETQKTQTNPVNTIEMQKALQGVSNGGGGATVGNRPIESFAQNPANLKGWKEVAAPTLAKLDKKMPNFSKALKDHVRAATWYLIPRSLVKIPDGYQGLPFNSDQSIINIKNEVFIDENMWKTKSANDAGVLLFHEISMLFMKRYYEGTDMHSFSRKLASNILTYIDQDTEEELAQSIIALIPATQILDPNKGIWYTHKSDSMFKTATQISNENAQNTDVEKIKNQLLENFSKEMSPVCNLQPLPLTYNQLASMSAQQSQDYVKQLIKVTDWIAGIYFRTVNQERLSEVCLADDGCNASDIWNSRFQGNQKLAGMKFLETLKQLNDTFQIYDNTLAGLAYLNLRALNSRDEDTLYYRYFSFRADLNNDVLKNKSINIFSKRSNDYTTFAKQILSSDKNWKTGYEYDSNVVPFVKNVCDLATGKN